MQKYLCQMIQDFKLPSPLQRIEMSLLRLQKVSLFVKRDDLIHKEISGNKYRKLKYNLLQARQEKHTTLVTFGGAFSNHIAATAVAGKESGFNTIGIIRGEEASAGNSTLRTAKENGMVLKFISRQKYAEKSSSSFLQSIEEEFGRFFHIPEGGSNSLAVKGCMEILGEDDLDFDFACAPCGTGTTVAGLVASLKSGQKALGFPALKGGGFIEKEVEDLLGRVVSPEEMQLFTDYHFGGYAKLKPELLQFANYFYGETGIPTDLVYTSKLFYGIFDLLKKGYFPQESTILAVHTGGLQGNQGMLERYSTELDFC